MEGRNDMSLFLTIAENLRFDFLIQNLVDEFVLFVKRKCTWKGGKFRIYYGKKTVIDEENDSDKQLSLKEAIYFCENHKHRTPVDFFDEKITEGFEIFFFILLIN